MTAAEPAAKKPKLAGFAALPAAQHAPLRTWIAAAIVEYLGEEEATLIDFIVRHVVERKAPDHLLPELKEVLEEDADGFLDKLVAKVAELSSA